MVAHLALPGKYVLMVIFEQVWWFSAGRPPPAGKRTVAACVERDIIDVRLEYVAE